MTAYNSVFKRVEKKYRIDVAERAAVEAAAERLMAVDDYGRTRITSLYLDTPERAMIARSVEKPLYKEKLRLRAYGDAAGVALMGAFGAGPIVREPGGLPLSDGEVETRVAAGLQVPEPIMASVRATQGHRTGWLDTFVGLNPAEWLGGVRCPVLAINGGKDTQVSPDNLDVICERVAGADVRLMPGLNHLMQHAVTGEVGEYSEIRETIAPDVLEAIVGFIKQGGDGR